MASGGSPQTAEILLLPNARGSCHSFPSTPRLEEIQRPRDSTYFTLGRHRKVRARQFRHHATIAGFLSCSDAWVPALIGWMFSAPSFYPTKPRRRFWPRC
jgi:hypothetical protein